jgi:hypothetical protein
MDRLEMSAFLLLKRKDQPDNGWDELVIEILGRLHYEENDAEEEEEEEEEMIK